MADVTLPRDQRPAHTFLDSHSKWVYLEELTHQAGHVISAADAIQEELPMVASRGSDRVYFALHALVAAAANISRLLWPAGARTKRVSIARQARAKALRELVGTEDNSVLESRAVRDHIEHYDERLDDYVASGQRNRTDRNVAPIGVHAELGIAEPQRHFDPETWQFSFGGDRLDVRAARAEAWRIRDAANKVLKQLQMR